MKKILSILFVTSIAINTLYAGEYAGARPEPKDLYAALNVEVKPDGDWIQKLNEWGVLSQPRQNIYSPSAGLPLFEKFPGLSRLAYINICNLPTPIKKLSHVINISGVELLVKCDDCSAEPYGGNKTRKFAFEIAKALEHGAKTILTFGCVASNHAVAVSEMVSKIKEKYPHPELKAICMLKPQPNSSVVRKNLLLHLKNGAELHFFPNNDARRIGTIAQWLDHKNTHGDYLYIIPTGGSTPLGAVGFVDAIFEILKQGPAPDYIYVPCGSCATTVGLLLGCKAAGIHTKVMAIATEPEDNPGEFKENITKLFHATNALLHKTDPSFPLCELTDEDINVNLAFTGESYGRFTKEGIEARELLKKTEGVITDGTYTAKAFAALLHDVRTQKVKGTVLFWNTYCSTEFVDHLRNANYKDLPVCLHRYFEEDVQELDREVN